MRRLCIQAVQIRRWVELALALSRHCLTSGQRVAGRQRRRVRAHGQQRKCGTGREPPGYQTVHWVGSLRSSALRSAWHAFRRALGCGRRGAHRIGAKRRILAQEPNTAERGQHQAGLRASRTSHPTRAAHPADRGWMRTGSRAACAMPRQSWPTALAPSPGAASPIVASSCRERAGSAGDKIERNGRVRSPPVAGRLWGCRQPLDSMPRAGDACEDRAVPCCRAPPRAPGRRDRCAADLLRACREGGLQPGVSSPVAVLPETAARRGLLRRQRWRPQKPATRAGIGHNLDG